MTSRRAVTWAASRPLRKSSPVQPLAVEQQPVRQHAGLDPQVRPRQGRPKIGVGRAPASAVMHGHVEGAEALLLRAVQVAANRIARLPRRLDEGVVKRIALTAALGVERPAAAAIGVVTPCVVFRPLEIGQDIGIGPTGGAQLPPMVEVARIAAHINHAVDAGGTAEHPTARAMHSSPAEMGLRLAIVAPVVTAAVHRDRQGRRHLDDRAAVAAAGLQQQHSIPAVATQPVGQYAAGGSGADDDIVVGGGGGHGLSRVNCRVR